MAKVDLVLELGAISLFRNKSLKMQKKEEGRERDGISVIRFTLSNVHNEFPNKDKDRYLFLHSADDS